MQKNEYTIGKVFSDNADFEIENGILKKYKGNDAHVVIPYGVRVIGARAFFVEYKIESVVIPATVTDIMEYAFDSCASLRDINIPSSVKNIEEGAFDNCTDLESIMIPGSVIKIGEHAFYCCDNLKSITVAHDNPVYKSVNGNLYSKDGKVLIQYAPKKEEKFFVIPYGVSVVASGAFCAAYDLESLIVKSNNIIFHEDSLASFDASSGISGIAFCDGVENVYIREDAYGSDGERPIIFVEAGVDITSFDDDWNSGFAVYDMTAQKLLIEAE